jgi:hypothetical protein
MKLKTSIFLFTFGFWELESHKVLAKKLFCQRILIFLKQKIFPIFCQNILGIDPDRDPHHSVATQMIRYRLLMSIASFSLTGKFIYLAKVSLYRIIRTEKSILYGAGCVERV